MLQRLHDLNNISVEVADKAKAQFLKLFVLFFSTFFKADDCLDKFYSDLLAKDNDSI